eukprot:COSAG02_NODE_303_length_25213_cov_126.386199_4_plen_204_part_00
MTVLEVFEAVALYIPFYYELKLALVIWLIHPQSKGAEVCFKQFVQPLLKKHEKDIDDGLTHLQVRNFTIAECATIADCWCSRSVAFVHRRKPGSICQHCERKRRRQVSSFHRGKGQPVGLRPRVATRACDNEAAVELLSMPSRQILLIRKLAFRYRHLQHRTKTTTSSLDAFGRLNVQQSLDTLEIHDSCYCWPENRASTPRR